MQSSQQRAERLFRTGMTASEVGRALGVATEVSFQWKKQWQGKSRDKANATQRLEQDKLRYREAFQQVVARFVDIKSILGNPGAVDYSRITGGQGKQYSDKGIGFRLIDYTIDVQRAAEAVLNGEQFEFWEKHGKHEDFDLTNQSAKFLLLQEILGQAFTERGLYPVKEYFKGLRSDDSDLR